MASDIWYSIRENRIRQGCLKGFSCDEKATLTYQEKETDNSLFLKALDGVDDGSYWGRLTSDLTLSDETVCYFYVAAMESADLDEELSDPKISTGEKIGILKSIGAKRFVNTSDILLYELQGRFLYFAVEMMGSGQASIRNIRIGARGDSFMNAFPQVYQERGGFFHRYLSVFSSIYNDTSDQNDKLYEMLDLNKCSANLLIMYASWFGIDLRGGFLPEDILRTFVKEAYNLNRIKGTKKALSRILEIFLGDEAVILENRLQGGGIYDVTVLVNRRLTDELRLQLTYLLDQFKPIRTRIRILQMEKDAVMDGNSYLDMNAAIPAQKHVILDEESMYDGTITLI